MQKPLFILMSISAVMLVFAPVSYAQHTIMQLTDNSSPDMMPQINGNGVVVWYRYSSPDWELFLYDGTTTTQFTENSYDDGIPQINTNGVVVCCGLIGPDWEIFLYDGTTTTQLTDNSYDDFFPQINANGEVVWQGYDGTDWEVFLYDGTTTTQLTNNSYEDSDPQINTNGNVVWQGYDGTDWEVFLYDGTTTTQLTNNSYDDGAPKINANGDVVWFGSDGLGFQIYLYDGTTTTPLVSPYFAAGEPQINVNREVVWQVHDGTDMELFLYDGTTATQLTDNSYDDNDPQINANGDVVWFGYDGTDVEIFFHDGTTTTQLTDYPYMGVPPEVQINANREVVWQVDDGSDIEIFLAIPCTDNDEDSVCADQDNCASTRNPLQTDTDSDGSGDLCDDCPADPDNGCIINGSSAEEIIASEGGTVETPDDKLTIEIDPGDLGEDTTTSVTEMVPSESEVDLTIGTGAAQGLALAVYDLEPDGLIFDSPVSLTIIENVSTLDQSQRNELDLYLFSDADEAFLSLCPPDGCCSVVENPTGTFTATCTAEVDHFSTYAMIAPLDTDDDGVADLFPPEEDNCPIVANPDQVNSDGDGYGEVCDCNDSNPNVNPGMPEILNNGIDDDCNPATPDIPPPCFIGTATF